MAAQSITFDFLSRGAASLSRDFRSIGDDSALSSRGVKVLSDVITKLGDKENRTSAESALLAKALKQTGDDADRAAAKFVLADAAVGRLGEQMKQAEKNSSGLNKALGDLKPNPGLIGPLVALAPALGTLGGVVAGVGAGLAGAFVAGGGALAAFGAVAKPVLTDALTASKAVNTAQSTYQATLKAGVPTAQAQATLQAANARAVLTYNAALAGGANPAKALAAEHLALAKNQLAYNSATNAGTFGAKAYAAEQKAISKAYADMSPQQIALSKQLGAMANAWQNLKAAQTPVVAGALQPWLKSVTDLTKNLAPIIAAVAPVIRYLGQQFDALVNSAAFKGFRDFIAGTGSATVSAAGSTIIDLVKSFIILLPKFDPLIREAVGWIGRLGPAVLAWSSSKKAADDIQSFIRFFSANGQVVGDLLKNIGAALKALAPGLTSGGAFELKVISDFFGLVAKLPASFAKPLAEVAGTLLVLSKLGVLKVGVQIVGAAAKWLTGGVVNLGGGAAAGAEIRAAMVSGGTAAAAEIRAAMTGGGAAAGAEGAAGGAAAKGGVAGGGAAAGAAALGVAAAGAFAGALIKAVGDTLSPHGTFAGRLNQMFQGLNGPVSTSVLHAFTFGGLEAWVTAKIGQPVGAALLATGKFIGNTWATIWANTIGGAVSDGKRLVAAISAAYNAVRNFITSSWNQTWAATRNTVDAGLAFLAGSWQKLASAVTSAYNTVRTSIANAWSAIWTNTKNAVSAGIAWVTGAWNNLKTGVTSAYNTVRTSIANAWSAIWTATRTAVSAGVANVVSFFAGLPGKITGALGNVKNLLLQAGKDVIQGFWNGLTSIWGQVTSWISGIASWIKAHKGPISLDKSLLYPAGQALMGGFLSGLKAGFGPVGSFVGGIASWVLGKITGAGGKLLGGKIVIDTSQFSASALAAGVAGGGVQQWKSVVLQALKMLHLSASLVNDVLYQMQTESGGRVNAINLTDSNAAAGHPSKGLMQVIQGTFDKYHVPGTSNNIYDPLANIAAALNYAAHNRGFGSGPGQIGSGHGYAYGTASALPGWAWVGERGPEMVRFRGGEQVIPAGQAGGQDGFLAELRALRAEVRQLTGVAAGIPAATGRHVGGAISGAAGGAGFRNRYPRGGA